MYSMVATFNDNVLCTCKLLREEILNVLTTHTHTHTHTYTVIMWGNGSVNQSYCDN